MSEYKTIYKDEAGIERKRIIKLIEGMRDGWHKSMKSAENNFYPIHTIEWEIKRNAADQILAKLGERPQVSPINNGYPEPCPDCQGTGKSGEYDRCVPPNPYLCERCKGTGKEKNEKGTNNKKSIIQ